MQFMVQATPKSSSLCLSNCQQANPAYGDITCRQVLTDLKPCEAYVKGSGPGTPPITCCHGLRTVLNAANTSECQIKLSKCFKKAIAGMQLRLDRIMQLPDLCHVCPPVTLTPKSIPNQFLKTEGRARKTTDVINKTWRRIS